MGIEQLDSFMAGIRLVESGSAAGNYSAIGPTTPEGNRARGAYQIMEQFWDGWAAQAGLPGADWHSRAAQDRVARYKFTQYYNKYRDWALVAIAWFKGPGIADQAQRDGPLSVFAIQDRTTGTSIKTYVQRVLEHLGEASTPAATAGQPAPPTPPPGIYNPDLSSLAAGDIPDPVPTRDADPEDILRGMFAAMSEMVRRNASFSSEGDEVTDLTDDDERTSTQDGVASPTTPQEVVGDIA